MAVFPSSASQLTTPAPSRSARESCWEHRDIYFACLDKEKVIVPGTEPVESLCKKEKEIYGKECAASWVDYFNKRRVLQARQDLMEAKAAEQRENGGPITGEKSVPVGGMGRK